MCGTATRPSGLPGDPLWPEPVKATGRLTQLAHVCLGEYLRPGDNVLDATAGNGHDTAFLARLVGQRGHVYAVDVQETAVVSAQERLKAEGLSDRLTWIVGDHARLGGYLPAALKGRLRAAVFNLGYLPGGDHSLTTRASTTCKALDAAFDFLGEGGVLCVTGYRGHPGGEAEYRAVLEWFERRRGGLARARCFVPESRRSPPVLLFAEKGTGKWQAH